MRDAVYGERGLWQVRGREILRRSPLSAQSTGTAAGKDTFFSRFVVSMSTSVSMVKLCTAAR